jgi:integrase
MDMAIEPENGAPTVEVVTRMYHKSMDRHTLSSQKRFLSAAEKWIIPILGPIPIDRLSSQDLRSITKNYLDTSSPGNKPHTLNGYRSLLIYLQAILNFAIRNGFIQKMPFSITLPNEPKPIPIMVLSEFGPFLKAVDSITNSSTIRLAIRMMLILGLRLSELTKMRWEWFYPDFSVIRLPVSKAKECRSILIPSSLQKLLLEYQVTWEQDWYDPWRLLPPWVFIDRKGRPGLPGFTHVVIKRAAETIGLHGKFTSYSLRRSCIEAGLLQFHRAKYLADIRSRLFIYRTIESTLPYVRACTPEQQGALPSQKHGPTDILPENEQ